MARVKVSVTVDPEILRIVDGYVAERGDLDRSKVMEQALVLWLTERQHAAMEEQFAGDDKAPEAERRAWEAVRRAAVGRVLDRS